MANYEAVARTNYFAVKDVSAFETEMSDLGLIVIRRDDLVGVMASAYDTMGGWLVAQMDATGTFVQVDMPSALARHLQPGHVAILIEAGAEDDRYVTGEAIAINAEGVQAEVNLNSIYALAAKLGPHVTRAEY